MENVKNLCRTATAETIMPCAGTIINAHAVSHCSDSCPAFHSLAYPDDSGTCEGVSGGGEPRPQGSRTDRLPYPASVAIIEPRDHVSK